MTAGALDDLAVRVDARFDEAVDLRRDLHRTPELSLAEHRTTAVLRERAAALGLREVGCGTQTGLALLLEGGRPGRTVLVRADIDALPVTEEVDVPFRSTVDGVMHACGHDAHTAILDGVGALLAARAEDLPGRYLLVYQPAEELLGGALRMIEGGLLEAVAPDAVTGLHVTSLLPTGLVGIRSGVAMSIAQRLEVAISGVGGHGAMAQTEGNVILAAAALASRLGDAAQGMEYEDTPCACSAGLVRAGTAANVVPRHAVVSGSLRTFTDEQHLQGVERLRALCAEIAAAHRVEVNLDLPPAVPAVVNDAAVTGHVRGAIEATLGSSAVIDMPPSPPSDDVSEFLQRVPGCYFFVGARPGPGLPPMHHAPDFAIDEGCLRVGMRSLTAAAVRLASG